MDIWAAAVQSSTQLDEFRSKLGKAEQEAKNVVTPERPAYAVAPERPAYALEMPSTWQELMQEIKTHCRTSSDGEWVVMCDLFRRAHGPGGAQQVQTILSQVCEAVDDHLFPLFLKKKFCKLLDKPDQGWDITCFPIPLGVFAIAKTLSIDEDASANCHKRMAIWKNLLVSEKWASIADQKGIVFDWKRLQGRWHTRMDTRGDTPLTSSHMLVPEDTEEATGLPSAPGQHRSAPGLRSDPAKDEWSKLFPDVQSIYNALAKTCRLALEEKMDPAASMQTWVSIEDVFKYMTGAATPFPVQAIVEGTQAKDFLRPMHCAAQSPAHEMSSGHCVAQSPAHGMSSSSSSSSSSSKDKAGTPRAGEATGLGSAPLCMPMALAIYTACKIVDRQPSVIRTATALPCVRQWIDVLRVDIHSTCFHVRVAEKAGWMHNLTGGFRYSRLDVLKDDDTKMTPAKKPKKGTKRKLEGDDKDESEPPIKRSATDEAETPRSPAGTPQDTASAILSGLTDHCRMTTAEPRYVSLVDLYRYAKEGAAEEEHSQTIMAALRCNLENKNLLKNAKPLKCKGAGKTSSVVICMAIPMALYVVAKACPNSKHATKWLDHLVKEGHCADGRLGARWVGDGHGHGHCVGQSPASSSSSSSSSSSADKTAVPVSASSSFIVEETKKVEPEPEVDRLADAAAVASSPDVDIEMTDAAGTLPAAPSLANMSPSTLADDSASALSSSTSSSTMTGPPTAYGTCDQPGPFDLSEYQSMLNAIETMTAMPNLDPAIVKELRSQAAKFGALSMLQELRKKNAELAHATV